MNQNEISWQMCVINEMIMDLPFPAARDEIFRGIRKIFAENTHPDTHPIYVGEIVSIGWSVVLEQVTNQLVKDIKLITRALIALNNIISLADVTKLTDVHLVGFIQLHRQFVKLYRQFDDVHRTMDSRFDKMDNKFKGEVNEINLRLANLDNKE